MSTAVASSPRKARVRNRFRPDRLPAIPPEAHTLKGFLAWLDTDGFPEKVRTLYLNGEVYLEMPEEEIQTHAAPKGAIIALLCGLNHEFDFGEVYTTGVLIANEEADVANNPDGLAVLWESLEAGRVKYVANKKGKEMYILGTPDWVMEIVSKTSVTKDTRKLQAAYQKAKISEYWLIDCRGKDIKFQILHWRKSGYIAASCKDEWQRSKVFARSFRLIRTRNRRGAWKYELLVKKES